MQITFEIPDAEIIDAAKRYGVDAFRFDRAASLNYQSRGIQAIGSAVNKAIDQIDFAALIAAAIGPMLQPTIDQVLREFVQKRAKKIAKELADSGRLFPAEQGQGTEG